MQPTMMVTRRGKLKSVEIQNLDPSSVTLSDVTIETTNLKDATVAWKWHLPFLSRHQKKTRGKCQTKKWSMLHPHQPPNPQLQRQEQTISVALVGDACKAMVVKSVVIIV